MEALALQVVPFLLVVCRLSGLFMIAPVLASASIPVKARALLVFVLALCMFGLVPRGAAEPLPQDVLTLCAAAVMEVFLGMVIGLLMLLPVAAVQLSGTIMGQQLGFGLGQVINPALESESDLLSETLMGIALAAFIVMGGLEALFVAVANTFAKVPLGTVSVGATPSDLVLGAFGSGLDLALRVCSPVLGILFIETIASAVVMKTMPQINILSIGFAIKIIIGLLALGLALASIDGAMHDSIASAARSLLHWSLPQSH